LKVFRWGGRIADAKAKWPKLRERLAVEFDACSTACRSTDTAMPSKMPDSVKKAMRQYVADETGFGFVEILTIMQALWLLWQVWQAWQGKNPGFRACDDYGADPADLDKFLTKAASETKS
jgi:hypothetical protein